MTAPSDDIDLHAAIAALRAERDAALSEKAALAEELAAQTVELAERKSEFGERIAQQAATIDVLKVMSASPDDPQPVFDLIVRRATELCESRVGLFEFDGSMHHLRAMYGFEPDVVATYFRLFPQLLDLNGSHTYDRAVMERQVIHIRDIRADPVISGTVTTQMLDGSAVVSIPLLRDGLPIGVIGMNGSPPGGNGFSDSQVALLETFAEQAVIAISSAETYRALQTRTADLQQSLEYQTATSDVLKVISRSAFDLKPVLDTLVETAVHLCDADMAMIFRRNGAMVMLAASFGFPPEYEAFHTTRGVFPYDPSRLTTGDRALAERRPVHIDDIAAVPGYPEVVVRLSGQRTNLGIPLLHQGEAIGTIVLARQRVEPFTDRQIDLVSTFADQAVIAIENTRLITEQHEALEQQTATAEVLQVINANPGNLAPVFDTILEKAHSLCGATVGSLVTYDGEFFRAVATHGFPEQHAETVRLPVRASARHQALLRGERFVQTPDLRTIELSAEDIIMRGLVEHTDARTRLMVPLRKDGTLLGFITAYRPEVRLFSDNEIALLENFAAQAVIAMENARLIDEQREALEQQEAIAEILQAINRSPGELQPVFDILLDKAMRLCEAAFGILAVKEDEQTHTVAAHGLPPALAEWRSNHPVINAQNTLLARVMAGEPYIHTLDLKDDDLYRSGEPLRRANVDLGGARTSLYVPLKLDRDVLGTIHIYRQEVRPFSDKEIALVESFGAQAVIAMENARLLNEVRQRQEELRVTFENMGDGVAMFDETQHLAAWNHKFQDTFDVPDPLLAEQRTYAEYIRYLAERGDYGPGTDVEEQVHRITGNVGQHRTYERTRPDGRVIEVRNNPVAGGGFVLIFSDITERKRSEAEIRAARDAAEEASRTIEAAYRDLKTAQANLIQAEKMASLGQLTAGIAHEIKNPLNFVNNFAALSVDLLSELKDAIAPAEPALTEMQRAEVEEVSVMLTSNLEKVTEHGKRADGIVKAMLEHSRGSSGERRIVDLNALIDEALNLAYHGARAQDQSFNITMERDFGEGISPIEVNPQDMTRVFLNIFSNGFYATTKRARDGGDAGFVPTLKVTSRDTGDAVEIRVRDNGIGIPADIRDKLFQPFFTTKPTGEGTGLGLSITYDIVTQQHGGTITADSNVGEYSEFTIRLPRNP